MSMSSGAKAQFEEGSLSEAIYDIYIGFVVGVWHSWYWIDKFFREQIMQPMQALLGIESPLDQIKEEKEKILKVVGVGYGRTGTYSLTLALEELGFPTLHTQHLYEHERIIGMWLDEVFLPSIEENNAHLRQPNFDILTDEGFQATCDLPMALYYEQIMEKYPDCKFILTTRSTSEEWFRSWDTLTKSITQPARLGNIIPAVRPYMIYLRWLFAMVNKDESYLTIPYPLPDQDHDASIASYEEHNRRVREMIPKDRLLEYSVKDGWEPLCDFLEIGNCPTTPFPKTNSARSVQVQAISSFIVPFAVIFFVMCLIFVKVFQRLTGTTVVNWVNWKIKEAQCRFVKALAGYNVPCPKPGILRKKS